MQVKIISPGKTKMTFISEGIQLYLKRLQHYLPVEYVELKETRTELQELKTEVLQTRQDFCNIIEEATNKKPSKKRVIVTHHVPTLHFYPEKYIGSDLNEAFAVELFDLIEEAKADFWIYGHHHCNVQPFKIGTTQLLTNQLGYVKQNEHKLFNHSAIIEI